MSVGLISAENVLLQSSLSSQNRTKQTWSIVEISGLV